MHVQVENDDLLHAALQQEQLGGDGKVIQNAEPRPEIWECVVRAAGSVACQPVVQGQASSQYGPCSKC